MKRFSTRGIVLNRTDYGEADRILTFLTPDHGKVRVMARGVRKSKSKLAGSIELFSVSDISFIVGRGEISTLISARLVTHYGGIVKDLDRTSIAYEFLKTIDKNTEDQPEPAYFDLLAQALNALEQPSIDLNLTKLWFSAQLLKLAGHSPNLQTQKDGAKLELGQTYDFDFESMVFEPGKTYGSNQIKFLRLLFSSNLPVVIQKVQEAPKLSAQLQPVVRLMLHNFVKT